MSSTPTPRRRNQPTGASPSRKQRARSTIGVNPLDVLKAPDSPAPILASHPATTRTPPESGDRDLDADLDGDIDLAGAGQRVFAAWVTGTEGVLKALFEAQQSTLRANLSVLEASTSAQRQITRELTAAARQAQAAALQAFRTRLRDASRH
jgi:hypothetical protein